MLEILKKVPMFQTSSGELELEFHWHRCNKGWCQSFETDHLGKKNPIKLKKNFIVQLLRMKLFYRYETRHNYEYQRRETTARIPVLNPGAISTASMSNIPPPTYELSDNSSVRSSLQDRFLISSFCFIFQGTWTSSSIYNCDRRHGRDY